MLILGKLPRLLCQPVMRSAAQHSMVSTLSLPRPCSLFGQLPCLLRQSGSSHGTAWVSRPWHSRVLVATAQHSTAGPGRDAPAQTLKPSQQDLLAPAAGLYLALCRWQLLAWPQLQPALPPPLGTQIFCSHRLLAAVAAVLAVLPPRPSSLLSLHSRLARTAAHGVRFA